MSYSSQIMERRDAAFLMLGLIGVAISLFAVGVVSDTITRHLLQIVPLLLATARVIGGSYTAAYVAAGTCLFWIILMLLIWLNLAGVPEDASRSYTTAEIVLSFVIAVFAALVIFKSVILKSSMTGVGRAIMITIGFGFQAVVIGASLWFLD